jgi:hypothetical protein
MRGPSEPIGQAALPRDARAPDVHTNPYPAALKEFQHSYGLKRSQMVTSEPQLRPRAAPSRIAAGWTATRPFGHSHGKLARVTAPVG